MSINLMMLQNFNNAVSNARVMSDSSRLHTGTFKLGGTYDIRQIPSNKYDRAANNAVRRNFAAALTGAFGVKSLEDLPANVRSALNISDFKLDKEGNITSTRPLTARRVRAVMSAIQEATAKAAPNLLVRDALVHFRLPVAE